MKKREKKELTKFSDKVYEKPVGGIRMKSSKSGKRKEITLVCNKCKGSVTLPAIVQLDRNGVPVCMHDETGLVRHVRWVDENEKVSIKLNTKSSN